MATDQANVQNRVRQATLAFQAAESFFLNAHRRMKTRQQADVDLYWAGSPGQQVKMDLRVAADEVEIACKAASAAGLPIGTIGRRLITQAQRYLAEMA
jgi:hypothetical protein